MEDQLINARSLADRLSYYANTRDYIQNMNNYIPKIYGLHLSCPILTYGYTYSDGMTLKNKYGMKGKDFEKRYKSDLAAAIVNLRQEPLPEKFDSSYLKYIHQRLYEKTFEWAGCTCDTPFTFSDGTVTKVPVSNKIKEGLERIDQTFAEKNNLQGFSREEFIQEASTMFALLNNIHPFIVGNKYAQRIFFEQLAEAAGHKLDFSVVTERRMRFAINAALPSDGKDIDDISPMHHLFEDISNPEKVVVLKEFMTYMREMDIISFLEMQNKLIVMPNEGETYTGIYKGCSLDSIMLMVKGSYVLCQKDYLSPATVKALRLDDKFTFTASMSKGFENILLPEEKLSSLTEKEIVGRIIKNSSVKKCRREIEGLSKIVYGNSRIVNDYMDLINMDSSLGEHHVRNVMNFPQVASKFSGIKILGLKTKKRKQAEANVSDLSKKIDDYINVVISTRESIIQEHQLVQERYQQVLKMPSQAVRDILNLPKEDRMTILNADPSLYKEVEDFVNRVKVRFSPSEHNAIGKNRYEQLAQSVGISVNKAKQISDITKKVQEICMQARALKVSDVRVKPAVHLAV
ncbi:MULTISPECIES: BID domain-containing T4SS effector [unclassified Bartonella]|uniref:BID domain-containing T4SS effector n=1 Tax=unclassified Bartonella TaxID=2645622 RepID=UPI0009C1F7B7|nr:MULTISPECIES: BID domain-containing T4SS effector [unclassified Bartonella]AQX27544.1 Bartonella effector protein Bep5/4 [Bartonella sp. JB15]AQX28823.1 Bartonella effector protein Bep5/1 [Bartonella sp. JB63]